MDEPTGIHRGINAADPVAIPPSDGANGAGDGRYVPAQAGASQASDALALRPIARVGAPKGSEATTEAFRAWVHEDEVLEKTQLVTVQTTAGQSSV